MPIQKTAGTPDSSEPGAALAMPSERRAAAKAHATVLSATMRRIAAEVPFSADVDDFRRLLVRGVAK
jgi:hypothetical protein